MIKADREKLSDQAIAESVGYRNLFFLFYIGIITVVVTLLAPYVEEHKKFWQVIGDDLARSSSLIIVVIVGLLCATWVLTSRRFFDGSLYRHNFLYVKDILALSLLRRKTIGIMSTGLSLLLVLIVFVLLELNR